MTERAVSQDILDGMFYIPLEEISKPRHLATVYVNRWWVVHPQKGAMFYKTKHSPQCNDIEWAARRWAEKFHGHKCLLISEAFI